MTTKTTLYGSPICSMVPPVRHLLERAEVEFDYIDIYRSSEGRQVVKSINHGNQSVPTLVFADGSTMTEPSLSDLQTKLESLGYHVPQLSWSDWLLFLLDSPFTRIGGLVMLMAGLSNGQPLTVGLGVGLFAVGWLYRAVLRR